MAYMKQAQEHDGPPDEALMLAVQRGDRAAFETIVRRYERRLYSFILRMVRRPQDAEDLAQEAFLRVYAHRARYCAWRPFRPWLYRIAANLCRDHGRRRRVRKALSLDAPAAASGDDSARPLGESVADAAAGPEATAAAREQVEALERAVAALPETHRAVFLMARYEGLAYADIARALGIPEGTVKSRMNTAVRRLLAAMEREA
jgi:RNA polymerase sigma-70 factor (ECF subfamily)